MGLTKVEFLEDRVRYEYFLKKPWGVSDEDGWGEVLYARIPFLKPDPTEEWPGRISGGEAVYVPNADRTLVFLFESYPEKSYGPMEEDFKGVYVK